MDQQPDPRAPEAPLVPRPSVVTSSGGAGFDTSISGAPPFQALPGAGQPYGQAPLPGSQPPPGYYYPPQPIYVTQQVQMTPAYVAVAPPKSLAAALLLTFFFGPLGLFYASVTGGVVMLLVTIVAAAFTFGVSVLVTWPICMIWAAIGTSNHNNRMVAGAGAPNQIVR
jgi:hypothetical protein